MEYVRFLLLCLDVAALGLASVRIASRATAFADMRIIAAATLACVAALLEALILGLVSWGENTAALTVAAILTYGVVRWRVSDVEGPRLGGQLVEGVKGLGRWDRIGLGGLGGVTFVSLAYLIYKPFTPYDGLVYHLSEPAIWLHNGRPGSLVDTSQSIPFQSYPKNTEIIFGWLLGISHNSEAETVAMFGFMALAALAVVAGLARLGVDRRRGLLVASAILLVPVVVQQLAGTATDVPAVCWIAVAGAVMLAALTETALVPVGLIAAGLAIGTKLTAIPLMALLLLLTGWFLRSKLKEHVVTITASVVVGGAVAAVWYIQDWVAFGSPLYPFYRFPSAGTLPPVITVAGKNLLGTASSTLKADGLHGYFDWFGGGMVVVAGLFVALLCLPFLETSLRRWVLLAAAVGVIELVLWSDAPFTGNPGIPGTAWFALDGVRYLLPGMAAVALPTALLVRSKRRELRYVADAIFGVAVLANIYALKYSAVPYRPALVYLVLGVLLGAGLAALFPPGGLGGRPLVELSRAGWRITSGVVVVVVVAGLTLAAPGFGQRAANVQQPPETSPLSIKSVVRWLYQQPSWRTGSQPVATGPVLDALLAGPTFAHDLILVTQSTRCSQVRSDVARDWLVLPDPVTLTAKYDYYQTFTRTTCLAGVTPVYSGAGFQIFAPSSN